MTEKELVDAITLGEGSDNLEGADQSVTNNPNDVT